MARRSNTATAPTTESQEDAVTTATPEAPASTETPAPEASDKPAEVEVDLTEFIAAVEAAVSDEEARDATTGELPAPLIEPVNAAYRKLDGTKAKNKAKAELNKLMKATMNDLNMPLARSYMILADKLSAGSTGGGDKKEKVPADPTEAFVQRIVGLQLAASLAQENVPEGVGEDWRDKANSLYGESLPKAAALLAWNVSDAEDKGDEPESNAVVRSAVKLAQGKAAKVGGSSRSGGSGDGVRRDIGKHIVSAFAEVESGTFLTIAQIRAHKSEEYAGVEPSAGAISARLFPTSGKDSSVEGVKAGTNESGKKGATKL